MSLEPLLTVSECAKHLQVDESFLWRRIRRRILPIVRLSNNRLIRIRESDLERFVASRLGAPDTRRRKPRTKSQNLSTASRFQTQ